MYSLFIDGSVSRTGCLLPFLITFNLFFGWMFLKPLHWLIIEAVLIFIFLVSCLFFIRKLARQSTNGLRKPLRGNAIDTDAEVLED